MPEALNSLPYDPALWAEAVAWQQECGVFDTLTAAPVDAIALRAAAKARPEVAKDATSRPEAREEAPATTWATTSAPTVAPASAPAANASPKPVAKTAPQAANQHGRRGLEAVADIAEAEKLAAACDSLEALQAAVEAFDGCLLKDTASSTVFADGQDQTDILVIGEAPGADEDRQGKPFVGRSGQMLDDMMGHVGLSRDTNFRITNIVFWRPPGNRKPNAGEIALCWPFSRRHIELVAPKVILAVGGLSAQTLIDPNLRITRERGKWREFSVGTQTIPVLPTLHPAYLLRQPVNKRQAWEDLLILKDFLRSGETP
ncbi:MAG: uracil-DNA glycosylase [Alphaproteobacteria bacterium]